MASEPVALLFMPPWDPIHLRPDRAVVIGRSPSCDLPVPSSRVSRRHAWVHREGLHYAVSDLGSTNGTLVNGVRIEGSTTLRPGDKIQVGDHTVTFCVMEPRASAETVRDDPDRTLVFSVNPRTTALEGIQGDLAQLPVYALLQMLEIGQRTGVLEVAAPQHRVRLWFAMGRPVHAKSNGKRGLDAALEIPPLLAGRFVFEPGGNAPEQSMSISVQELLLEATRHLAHSNAAT